MNVFEPGANLVDKVLKVCVGERLFGGGDLMKVGLHEFLNEITARTRNKTLKFAIKVKSQAQRLTKYETHISLKSCTLWMSMSNREVICVDEEVSDRQDIWTGRYDMRTRCLGLH